MGALHIGFISILLSGGKSVVQAVQKIACHHSAVAQVIANLAHLHDSFLKVRSFDSPGQWGFALAVQVVPALIGQQHYLTDVILDLCVHGMISFQ